MECYDGKVVLVTGASSGLGLSIVKQLATRSKISIIATGRSVEKMQCLFNLLQSASVNIECRFLDLEGSDDKIATDISNAISAFGTVDVLINCAGMGFRGRIEDTNMLIDRKIMQVDYFGQIAVIKGVISRWRLEGRRQGQIIQVSSVQGYFGITERAPYSSAKHALIGFIDSLRVEISEYPANDNFRITLVSPGYIATNHSINALTASGSTCNTQDEYSINGFPPAYVANEMLLQAAIGKTEIIIADSKVKLLIILRALCPALCFRILRNRYSGRKESLIISIIKCFFGLT